MYNVIKQIVFLLLITTLTACSSFFDKDNTPEPSPLPQFKPSITPTRLWSSTHAGFGSGSEHLRIGPALGNKAIFIASTNGTVTSIDKTNGNKNWQVRTGIDISTSPGVGNNLVVVGSQQGEVLALSQQDGQKRWKVTLSGAILAKPAINQDKVLLKTVNGEIKALSAQDGHELWSFQQTEPNLILRGGSSPLILENSAIIGFANGNLIRLNLQNGQIIWTVLIATPTGAFAISRMVDIDADPILFEHQIYAATYQGKIASLDFRQGTIKWSYKISSYTGMAADTDAVYISDAKSNLWAFDAKTGSVKWRQTKLKARLITGPVLIGNYVVVGDQQGFLHWLDKRTGLFAAHDYIGAMSAAPLVQDNVLYTLTNSGYLVAYTLN